MWVYEGFRNGYTIAIRPIKEGEEPVNVNTARYVKWFFSNKADAFLAARSVLTGVAK